MTDWLASRPAEVCCGLLQMLNAHRRLYETAAKLPPPQHREHDRYREGFIAGMRCAADQLAIDIEAHRVAGCAAFTKKETE